MSCLNNSKFVVSERKFLIGMSSSGLFCIYPSSTYSTDSLFLYSCSASFFCSSSPFSFFFSPFLKSPHFFIIYSFCGYMLREQLFYLLLQLSFAQTIFVITIDNFRPEHSCPQPNTVYFTHFICFLLLFLFPFLLYLIFFHSFFFYCLFFSSPLSFFFPDIFLLFSSTFFFFHQ